MPGEYFSVFLATLYFLRPTLGEFTDLVCEPSQRATSQFEDSDRETTNISSENLLDGFARFAHVTGELAEPTKVRRFLKLVKRAACLTYVPNFNIAKCPGQPISAARDKTFVVNQPRLVRLEVVLYLLPAVSRNVPAE